MITESKEKALTKKIVQEQEEDIGFCTECDYIWCFNRAKIIYCSFKYKGIRGYFCQNNNCDITD